MRFGVEGLGFRVRRFGVEGLGLRVIRFLWLKV